MIEHIQQKYEYKDCEEVYQRVIDAVDNFYKTKGIRPSLILGWGTYLNICIVETKMASFMNPNSLIKPTQFEGCDIQIDPVYEFRIQPLFPSTPWENAIEALILDS